MHIADNLTFPTILCRYFHLVGISYEYSTKQWKKKSATLELSCSNLK